MEFLLDCPSEPNLYLDLNLGNHATPLWVLSVLDSVLFVLHKLVLPKAAELVSLDIDGMVGRMPDDSLNGDVGKVVPRGIVESQHGPRSGGGTLLNITRDVKLESVKSRRKWMTDSPWSGRRETFVRKGERKGPWGNRGS